MNYDGRVAKPDRPAKLFPAIYEDGKMDEDESNWVWHGIDYAYDEEADITYVPEGWYEYEHFCQEDEYNNSIDEVVVKWMPLPEPYKEKQ